MPIQKLAEEATITAKGQTTVPRAIRLMLGVAAGDRIVFRAEGGRVLVEKAEAGHDDPAIGAFLALIEADIAAGRNVAGLPADLEAALRRAADAADDPDAPIDGDVCL